MDDFPEFMKRPANRIATSSQATPGVEGYVFDGVDGSQVAFWTCRETALSTPHVHDFDGPSEPVRSTSSRRGSRMGVNRWLAPGRFTRSADDAPIGPINRLHPRRSQMNCYVTGD
jgi:hypothetical protein